MHPKPPALLRRLVVTAIAAALLVFGATPAALARIGVQYQMLLGNPSSATTDTANTTNYLIQRAQYALSYNNATGQPNWVSWNLTSDDIGGSGRGDFVEDTTLPAGYYRVLPSDYSQSGYDRGHMCPSGDRTVSRADNDVTFYMSNIIPQTASNNQGVWANFEVYCRSLAGSGNEILIISGPSFFGGSRILSGAAAIPGYTWKIAVVVPPGAGSALDRITTSTRVIAIRVPNTNNVNSAWQTYLTTVNQIQQDTGYTFFTALSPSVASVLRASLDGQPVAGIPSITTHPISQTAAVGGTASFTVAATGDAPLSYQWYFDGEEIPDATGPTLTLANIDILDMGSYYATVSNSVGTITSSSATLVVTGVAPFVVTEPVSRTVSAGGNTVFSVEVAGSPTIGYQWRRNGTPIPNAIFSLLTLNNVQASDAGDYDVVVANSAGFTNSATVSLTVNPAAPTITTQPVSRTTGLNGTTSFTVAASGTEPISYQWRKDGQNITHLASATSATLALAGVTEAMAGTYDVVVSNSVGSVTSVEVTLSVSAFSDGAINLTGGTYTQNFDTLRSGPNQYDSQNLGTLSGNGPFPLESAPFDGSGMIGWWGAKHAGSAASGRFVVDDGNFVSGAIYSYGSAGSSDRALGALGSGSNSSRFGVKFVNSTGQTLTEFSLSYIGEQWRRGSGGANTLTFEYAIDATDINTGNFVGVPSLNVTAPVAAAPNGVALDGNASQNRVQLSGTISGLFWPAGSTLVLRWSDVDDVGSDDGLAIDDFSITVAQPTGPTPPAVLSTSPAYGASAQSTGTNMTITFNQPVTLGTGWFSIISATNGPVSATVTGGPNAFTLAPPVLFAVDDQITVTIFADKVSDQATGTLPMAEDYTFSFTTAAPQPPAIAVQPQSQSVPANGSVNFSVSATGTAPLSFQWRKNGTPINTNVTATSSTLSLTNVQAGDAGQYDVVITNAAGSATSAAATLTVTAAVTDVIRWNFGTTSAMAAPSSGMPSGMTGGTLSVGNNNGSSTLLAASSVSGGYSGVSGGYNAGAAAFIGSYSTSSTYFQVTLTPPAGQRVSASALSFGSRSTGTGPQGFAVYTSADNYASPAATGSLQNDSTWRLISPTFTTVNGAVGSSVTFRIYGYGGVGTPSAGSVNWRIDDLALTVVLQAPPSITTQPSSATREPGETVNFSVSAQGTPTLTYQWRLNGQPISAQANATATTATLTLDNVQPADAGDYDVVVTNVVGSVTSGFANLTVLSTAGGFDSWLDEYFTPQERADPAISGPDVVLAGDGLSNLMKYALGLDPRTPATSGLPATAVAGGELVYTYTRPADRTDITYVVQASTDLLNWSSDDVTHELLASEGGVETWGVSHPIGAGGRLFFRLVVSRGLR